MHDIKDIRANPEKYDRGWARRGLLPQTSSILELDNVLRNLKTQEQDLLHQKNVVAGQFKDSIEKERLATTAKDIKEKLAVLSKETEDKENELHTLLASLPNLPAESSNEEDRLFAQQLFEAHSYCQYLKEDLDRVEFLEQNRDKIFNEALEAYTEIYSQITRLETDPTYMIEEKLSYKFPVDTLSYYSLHFLYQDAITEFYERMVKDKANE